MTHFSFSPLNSQACEVCARKVRWMIRKSVTGKLIPNATHRRDMIDLVSIGSISVAKANSTWSLHFTSAFSASQEDVTLSSHESYTTTCSVCHMNTKAKDVLYTISSDVLRELPFTWRWCDSQIWAWVKPIFSYPSHLCPPPTLCRIGCYVRNWTRFYSSACPGLESVPHISPLALSGHT